MGDVQSGEWTIDDPRAHTECAEGVDQAAAEAAAQKAIDEIQNQIWILEAQIEEAKMAYFVAQGRFKVVKHRPKRHEVLIPTTQVPAQQIYTYCMQLGYRFALVNGTVHYAGLPGEGLINSGLKLEDLPA